jgi:hypothetical protein
MSSEIIQSVAYDNNYDDDFQHVNNYLHIFTNFHFTILRII